MIPKGSTIGVYIYVSTEDGLPATGKASSILGTYYINDVYGAELSLSGVTFIEIDDFKAPGWYMFSYTFNDVGTAFMIFQCDGCIIAPWEEQIVDLSSVDKAVAGLLHWAVSSNTLTLYNPTNTSLGTYTLTRDSEGNITSVTPNA